MNLSIEVWLTVNIFLQEWLFNDAMSVLWLSMNKNVSKMLL